MSDSIGLAEFIEQVKHDLVEKPDDGNSPPVLMVDNVEVELQVVTSKDGRGGVKVSVLAASGEIGGGLKRDDTHKVRVTLTPIESHADRLAALKGHSNWARIHEGQQVLNKEGVRENQKNL